MSTQPYVRHPDDRRLWRAGIRAVSVVLSIFWAACLFFVIFFAALTTNVAP